MGFSKEYRTRLVDEVTHRFKCYWHVMHPVTFNSNDLYRLAFSSEEWDALMLLRQRYRAAISTGWSWTYMTNEDDDGPKIGLTFSTDDELPNIELNERDVPDILAKRLRGWALRAKHYDDLDTTLRSKLNKLVRLQFQYKDVENRRVEKAIVNTPGTLHRVWPEILPFLDNQSRDTMREKRMRSPMPKDWDDDDYKEFHEGPEMEELAEALIAMALLPKDYDENYPTL